MILVPTVRLSFSPTPAHVRTARLVGAAVARRAGVGEEQLEEIRLAIGEACSRAVAMHRSSGISDLVDVVLTDGDRFTVEVTDRVVLSRGLLGGPVGLLAGQGLLPGGERTGLDLADLTLPTVPLADLPTLEMRRPPQRVGSPVSAPAADTGKAGESAEPEALMEEAVAARMGLALLAGLVDDLQVSALTGGSGTRVRMSWPVDEGDLGDDED